MAKRAFEHEIKCMMYSFGDARHPSPESAALVEEIVHRQMSEVICHASEVASVGGARSVSVEDILFLLRKDKGKLRRVVRHLQMKEMTKKTGSSASQTNNEEEGNVTYPGSSTPANKKRKYSLRFLTSVDQIGNHDEMDELQLERLQRQDNLTATMDVDEYLNYSECRLINFHKNTTKFKEWLGIEQKLIQEVVEVYGYLAYETVREIVELSLLVKKDMGSVSFSPSSSHQPNLQDPNTPSEFGSTPTFFTTPVTQQPTGNGTPPTSPPAPSPQPVSTRGRKRKRKSDATSQPLVVNQDKTAIQPAHVREALRRYHNNIGPLIPFATHVSKTTFTRRTLGL